MSRRTLSTREKIFWSAIALGSGLTIFFYGVSSVPIDIETAATADIVRGCFTIGVGILLLVLGFRLAPYGELRHLDHEVEEIKKTDSTNKAHSEEAYSENSEYQHSLFEERKSLLNALLDQSRSFDKYVLTLAGGALGLSLVFIQQIAPQPSAETIGFLVGAWSAFGASILMTLISFLFSQKACEKQIEILNGLLNRSLDPDRLPPNLYRTVTSLLNWISMATFVAGVASLSTFAIRNLQFFSGA